MSRAMALGRFTGMILAAAAGVMLFFGSFGRSNWPSLLHDLGVAVLFSVLIGGPLQLLLPRVAPLIWRRTRPPFNWLLLVAIMMGVASAGSAVAIGILVGARVLPASAFWSFFSSSLRIAVAITLTFGVGVTLYERLRRRADAAELALRTKERDEAEARRLVTEAQLASLESRVQPHFLFNTLNSIAALIPQDPGGAERMTGQLASLLRSSLDGAGTPLVPLAQELRSVRDYLEIERVRFGDRLQCAVDVPPDLERVLVPRLALQTLVENSVKYAVSPRREGGSVRVLADADPSHARLIVEDDGPGFDPALAPDHHGLALLRERLRLSFGERASLEVQSQPGRTRVLVAVPR